MGRLSLGLLGPLQITHDGQPVDGFAYNKARALLVYLVVEAGRAHTREALVGMLWPELPDSAARTNLRQALANLREVIGDAQASPPLLLITRDTIQFNPASDHELDLATFTRLLASCATHAHRHRARCRSCAERMEQALALYRGDFLTEFSLGDSAAFEEWQLRHRERLRQQVLEALIHLATYHERRGHHERARQIAQRQIDLDPWNETAHRQLMLLSARAGQRSAALAQYATCRSILARDLSVTPEAATIRLYESIRDGVLSATQSEVGSTRPPPTAIPIPPTALVGREAELAELGALLENPAHRLVTIIGAGGIGKTHLALAAAAEQAQAFADGAAFVQLAAINSALFMAPTILASLSVILQGQRSPHDQLLDYLREKELLLVLDNIEQLLVPTNNETDSMAELLADILARAPRVTLLVTSRERLALPGEWLFDLAELSYPASDSINNIKDYSAVQLFVQRARQVRRQFILTDADSYAVSRICRLVEGLPLALELAAAALHGRSCIAIADAIETSISTLSIEMRAVPQRQRSIWATFEHSWRLLTDQERRVFAQLSVFRGGFDADAAAGVTQASPQQLAALADKSLLRRDGVSRFDMHELVRQYASEKLAAAGDAQATQRKHALYFLALIQSNAPKLHGPEQTIWLTRFDLERGNLRAVLRWAIDCLEAEIGLQLAGNLFWFWYTRSDYTEGRAWLEQLLALSTSADVTPAIRIEALNAAGALMRKQDSYLEAAAQIEASLSLAREVGDIAGMAWSLHLHGLIAHDQGRYTQAIAYSEESLGLYRQIKNQWGIGASFFNLGRVRQSQGNYKQAMAHYDQSLIVWQAAGDIRGIAFALLEQGSVAKNQNTYDRASDLFGQSLLLFRELGDKWGIAKSLLALGQIAQQRGDNPHAKVYYTESLALFQGLGLNAGSAACREGLAELTGQPERPIGAR